MRAMIALLAITGNIGFSGAGWVYANLQSHLFDNVKDPVASFPPDTPDKNIRVSISTAKLGSEILNTADPPIKMIWVERGNPVTQNPDTNIVLKAIRSLDYRVVVDQFLTDTAREADIVLPAKTMFEQADVINAYWHSYIQYKAKIIDPPEEVKPQFLMNPADAANLKIKNGDLIRVFNDRGELEGEVKFDFGLKRNCVSMTNGWWIADGGTVNFLSVGKETDMGYGAAFHDATVNIERIK